MDINLNCYVFCHYCIIFQVECCLSRPKRIHLLKEMHQVIRWFCLVLQMIYLNFQQSYIFHHYKFWLFLLFLWEKSNFDHQLLLYLDLDTQHNLINLDHILNILYHCNILNTLLSNFNGIQFQYQKFPNRLQMHHILENNYYGLLLNLHIFFVQI